MTLKIAVCASGNGSNLQAIIDACAMKNFPAEIVCVISNKVDAYALERAKKAHIPSYAILPKDFEDRLAFEKALHAKMKEYNVDLICFAGFLWLVGAWFCEQWPNKILNMHPSLLPAFKGLHAPRQALERGVKIAGCTVHYVVEEMDEGAILAQTTVPVYSNDTEETLKMRIHYAEHQTFPYVIRAVAENRITWKGNNAYISS